MRAYLLGLLLSAACTLASFGLAAWHISNQHSFPTHEWLIPALIALAVMQLSVQLACFLHLGDSPTRTRLALIFAGVITLFIIGGTVWIMTHLTHHAQSPFDGVPAPAHQHGG